MCPNYRLDQCVVDLRLGGETQNGLGLYALRIERRVGSAPFLSWFNSVRLVEVRKEEIVLSAATRFVAIKIVEQFEPQVLECFRPEYPELVRVVVIVAAPAAKDSTGPFGR
ncbi:chromosomal replication initiation ATPase DnaA [Bradyrhizobium sp. USDA 3686]|uniref:DnaA N-terminal domain-containing protein n=1 Tax=Bradyrhizobium canariense TaxID=255045 RepID=UPI0039088D05|nr:chromosomal replication initiation ATPase DnaA [Bradyrhizobium canariense]